MMTATALVLCVTAAQAQTFRERWREAARERARARVQAVRAAVDDFYRARESGDKQAAVKAAEKARAAWSGLPSAVRTAVDKKYPQTGERINSLATEYDYGPVTTTRTVDKSPGEVNRESVTTTARGRTYTAESQSIRDGNTVSTTGSRTNASGRVVREYDGSTTREGNTATHHHEISNGRGETVRTNDTTVTRTEPGTRDRDTTITTKNGGTIDVDATKTRDGSTVTTDKSVTLTNAEGKSKEFDYSGQATKDGTTISKEGAWTNSDGKTVRSIEADRTRDGNTATYHKEVRNGNDRLVRQHDGTAVKDGGTVTREGTVQTRRWNRDYQKQAVKDGSTVTRTGSGTVTRKKPPVNTSSARKKWQPKYKDRDDIFGNRPRPKKQPSTPKRSGGASRAKRGSRRK
jgi:hypothetical protein